MEAEVKPYSKLTGRLYSAVKFALVARLAEGALTPRDVVDLAFGFRFRDPIASLVAGRDICIDVRPVHRCMRRS